MIKLTNTEIEEIVEDLKKSEHMILIIDRGKDTRIVMFGECLRLLLISMKNDEDFEEVCTESVAINLAESMGINPFEEDKNIN